MPQLSRSLGAPDHETARTIWVIIKMTRLRLLSPATTTLQSQRRPHTRLDIAVAGVLDHGVPLD